MTQHELEKMRENHAALLQGAVKDEMKTSTAWTGTSVSLDPDLPPQAERVRKLLEDRFKVTDFTPEKRLAYFKQHTSDPQYVHRGWHGTILEIGQVGGVTWVKVQIRPRLYSKQYEGAIATIPQRAIEYYQIKGSNVNFVRLEPAEPAGVTAGTMGPPIERKDITVDPAAPIRPGRARKE